MDKKQIKAVIFDLDGTLFDSEYYQWQGWVEPLKKLGIELTKEDYFKYSGKQRFQVEEELYRDYGINMQKGELLAQKTELLDKWFNEKIMPTMPFAKEAVEFFKNHPDYKIALCSTSPRNEIMSKLLNANFVEYFDTIISSDEVERGKPYPDLYLYCAKELNIDPENCLAIEDTMYGLQSAKDAGMFCYAVPNEYSLNQDFSRADKILSSLKDLIDEFS